jgi:shikimate kinase
MTRIFLIGFMGSGKSYWGRRLAAFMHWPFYDLDTYITEKEQQDVTQIFLEKGEAYFRELERSYLDNLLELESVVIATGGGTPCFHGNMDKMLKSGYCIYLQEPEDILFHRLLPELEERPLIRDLDEGGLSHFITEKLAERLPYYQASQVVVKSPRSLEDIWQKLKLVIH